MGLDFQNPVSPGLQNNLPREQSGEALSAFIEDQFSMKTILFLTTKLGSFHGEHTSFHGDHTISSTEVFTTNK